jgi:hypothetical protein
MTFTPDKVAQKYFDEVFFTRVTNDRYAKKRARPEPLLAELEARYGCALPRDLRQLVELTETYDLSRVCAGEWQNMTDALAPLAPGKNLFEQAVALDQKNCLGTALVELMCSLVPIGHARSGDVYMVFVDPSQPDRCPVYIWDHEEATLAPFADSISSLAYLTYLYELDHGEAKDEDDGGDILDTLKQGLGRLAARVAPSWHYRSLYEKTGINPTYEAPPDVEFLYLRSAWARRLLTRGAKGATDAKAWFIEPLEMWHERNTFSQALDSPRFLRWSPPAYWLLYGYFFDDADVLERAVLALQKSKSQFARDAAEYFATLVERRDDTPKEKRKAKAPLGKIADIVALKKKFVAAETGAARERREREERAKAEAARAGFIAEADAIASGASKDAILAAAVANANRPVVVERLYERLREQDPDIARTMKRLDVLADSQAYREHKLARQWLLAHAARSIAPLLAARGGQATLKALEAYDAEASKPAVKQAPPPDSAEALAAWEALHERRRGSSVYVIARRLHREALANDAGAPVSLDIVRRALRVAAADRTATAALHLTALRLLAAHATEDEVRETALRLLTWDLDEARAAAKNVLVALGETDRTRVVDRIEAEEIFEREGTGGLRAALRDPWAYPKLHLVEVAIEKGAGSAVVQDAIESFRQTYGPFEEGHGYYSGNYDVMLDTVRAITEIDTPDVDAFLRWLVLSRSPLLQPVIRDDKEMDRARRAGSIEPDFDEGVMELTSFSAPMFVLGAPIHGLARAGERIIAAGQGNSAMFDGAGRALPLPGEILIGHAYDVAVDPSGRFVAVCYHACHLVALEVDTGRIVMRLQLGGVPRGIRKVAWSPSGHFLATASDDQSIRVVDTTTRVEVMRHDEPYDVNGIAWLDEERLAFITDHHVGVLPRAGGAPLRLDVGGGADVIVHEGRIVATTNKHGVAWIDPLTMKVSRKLPVKRASRVRIAPDGNLAWVTVYEGDASGLWRFSIADKKSGGGQRVISGEELFALAIDPLSGAVIAGGNAGRIHHVRASGEVVASGPGTHCGAIEALTVEEGDSALALDATGRALRWSVDRRSAEAPWGALAEPYSPHSALVMGDGSLVVSAMNDTSAYAKEERLWSLATKRSEAAIAMRGEIITGSGRELIWVDPKSGQISAKAHGGVDSSWIHFILAVDDDAFLVAGYDDPKLARWSARERAMKSETTLDRRYDDGRYARTYAMTLAPVSRRLYVSFWNHTFDVIDPVSLEVVRSYDVDDNYAAMAVDNVERWAVMAAGHFIDVIDLETGRRVARRMAPAEVKSVVMVGAGVALAGLATGQIMHAAWLTS